MKSACLPSALNMPGRVLSGPGTAESILAECAACGSAGVLICGVSLEKSGNLDGILAKKPEGLSVHVWKHTGGEPTADQIENALDFARERKAQWVAGVGGGSVLDIAKACAGLLNAPSGVVAYHDGAPIPASKVPFIAAPTTAGTGSEATSVSVFTNTATNVKKSIRHPSFMARSVVLDAALMSGCPRAVIASAGMDALTQAIESYVSRGASRFTDMLALEAVRLISPRLPVVFKAFSEEPAQALLEGSFLAGVALAHARLGVVHGLAHPLGARCHLPHGLVCAVCLPLAIEFNREVMAGRYKELGAAIGGDLLSEVRGLSRTLGIGNPFHGRVVPDCPGIASETLASGSTAANPRPVKAEDVNDLLNRLFA